MFRGGKGRIFMFLKCSRQKPFKADFVISLTTFIRIWNILFTLYEFSQKITPFMGLKD